MPAWASYKQLSNFVAQGSCILILVYLFYGFVSRQLAWPLPIRQVCLKSYLPSRKICLSWGTRWDFFQALLPICAEGEKSSKACKIFVPTPPPIIGARNGPPSLQANPQPAPPPLIVFSCSHPPTLFEHLWIGSSIVMRPFTCMISVWLKQLFTIH